MTLTSVRNVMLHVLPDDHDDQWYTAINLNSMILNYLNIQNNASLVWTDIAAKSSFIKGFKLMLWYKPFVNVTSDRSRYFGFFSLIHFCQSTYLVVSWFSKPKRRVLSRHFPRLLWKQCLCHVTVPCFAYLTVRVDWN